MEYEQLLEYMEMIIDLEKNTYIQEQTIRDLERSASVLAKGEQILKPGKIQYTADEEGLGPGIIVGIIVGVAGFFVYPRLIPFDTSDGSIGNVFATAIIMLILCGLTGLLCGAIIRAVVNKSYNTKYKKEAEEGYKYSLAEYDKAMKKENERMELETKQKNYLDEQIKILKEQNIKTRETLEEFYSYNIIDERYRYDIVALCTLFQYLKAGQTYTLRRDNQTGDQGAYNIYENAYLAGLVLKKLDDVMDKMDVIIQNQNEIVRTMRESNSKIQQLEHSVITETNRLSRKIDDSSEQQAALQYSVEQNNSLLAFRNTMDAMYSWK